MKTCCKVGICGHFGNGKSFLDGQTVKTKMIYQILKNKMNSVDLIDTYCWQKKIFQFITNCFSLIQKSENIILLPAQNGVKVFIPFFWFINLFFKRKIHYVVIGGWLPEFLEQRKWLCFFLKKIDYIYVEMHTMCRKLEALQFKNVFYMPNCKELHILNESELVCNTTEPYRLCTFSRVMKEKGIEDAVSVVKSINIKYGRTVCMLDIYGQIDKKYHSEFHELMKGFPDFIQYKGCIPSNLSIEVLKKYYLLLFPTRFQTEGLPGTIIDSFAAGVPVVAAEWEYCREMICDGVNGFIYPMYSISYLENILCEAFKHSDRVNEMKRKCLASTQDYMPERAMKILIENLQK